MAFRKAPVLWQHRLWGNGDVTREYNNGIFFTEKRHSLAEDSKLVFFLPAEMRQEKIFIALPENAGKSCEEFSDAVRKDKSLISCT